MSVMVGCRDFLIFPYERSKIWGMKYNKHYFIIPEYIYLSVSQLVDGKGPLHLGRVGRQTMPGYYRGLYS